jgi:hypothetical protein
VWLKLKKQWRSHEVKDSTDRECMLRKAEFNEQSDPNTETTGAKTDKAESVEKGH